MEATAPMQADPHWLAFFARFGAEVLAAHRRQEPQGLMRAFQRSLSLSMVDALSWEWGCRSPRLAMLRRPAGVAFQHCAECRIPTTPSGGAVLTPLPLAVTPERLAHLCESQRVAQGSREEALIPDFAEVGPPSFGITPDAYKRLKEGDPPHTEGAKV